ncbi:hypothetical protein EC950183_3018, partial [Escherichia coli 95.0183]
NWYIFHFHPLIFNCLSICFLKLHLYHIK